MDWLVGTSGYSYKEWKGSFYPDKLPAREMLAFYAQQLPAVEINNTFYRLPKQSVLESWAGQVPDDFRFVIKASRRITHFKRLRDTDDETGYLLDTLRALGDRLGAILFQLPPNLGPDMERLQAFADLLGEDTPAAFEFRHPGWDDTPVADLLAARGWARVRVDDGGADPAQAAIDAGPGWGYLRLRGASYDRAALSAWAARIASSGAQRAFVFFKHEDAGAGPRLAADFLEAARRGARRRPAAARSGRGRSRESA